MYTDRDTDVARVRVGMAVPESPPEIVQDGRFLQVRMVINTLKALLHRVGNVNPSYVNKECLSLYSHAPLKRSIVGQTFSTVVYHA
jgi:hypothetical protein